MSERRPCPSTCRVDGVEFGRRRGSRRTAVALQENSYRVDAARFESSYAFDAVCDPIPRSHDKGRARTLRERTAEP